MHETHEKREKHGTHDLPTAGRLRWRGRERITDPQSVRTPQRWLLRTSPPVLEKRSRVHWTLGAVPRRPLQVEPRICACSRSYTPVLYEITERITFGSQLKSEGPVLCESDVAACCSKHNELTATGCKALWFSHLN